MLLVLANPQVWVLNITKTCKDKKGTSNKEGKDIYSIQTVLFKVK